MLGDGIMEMYTRLIVKRSRTRSAGGHVWCRTETVKGSLFYSKLTGEDGESYNYELVKNWNRRNSILNTDKILVPVHLKREVHWIMGCINLKDKRFEVYDSMCAAATFRNLGIPETSIAARVRKHKQLAQKVAENMRKWLRDETKERTGEDIDLATWDIYIPGPQCPQQDNGVDCGVFALKFADAIGRGLEVTQQKGWTPHIISIFRDRLALECQGSHEE